MSMREALQHHLKETEQVMQTRRYKWLWATAMALSLVSVFHVFEPEYWQMRRVRRHIENISPRWDAFKRAHPGFEAVELFPRQDMASGVSLAAKGRVHWSVDLTPLAEFMWSTQPPSSIDISKVTTDLPNPPTKKMTALTPDGRRIEVDVLVMPEAARSKAELGGATNGSQPIRSVTNSTSSAAGSRR